MGYSYVQRRSTYPMWELHGLDRSRKLDLQNNSSTSMKENFSLKRLS
jgi:hypothetical protein